MGIDVRATFPYFSIHVGSVSGITSFTVLLIKSEAENPVVFSNAGLTFKNR